MPARTPKKALVDELTAVLLPVLTRQDPVLATLPRGVTQAVEQLADAVLRWQTRQQAPSLIRDRSTRTESDELAGLLADRFQQESEEQPTADPTESLVVPPISSPTAALDKKRRPRLRKGE